MKVKGGKAGGNVMSLILLVVALVVAYYVVRYFMSSMDGFQAAPNPKNAGKTGNCDWGELKIVYDEGGPDQTVICFKKGDRPQGFDLGRRADQSYFIGNAKPNALFPDLTTSTDGMIKKLATVIKKTRVATPGDCIRAELYSEPNYGGYKVIQTGKNDNMAWGGDIENTKIKIASAKIYDIKC